MHKDLEKWLQRVWKDRSLIMKMAPSYKNRGEKHHANDSINTSVQYISDLLGSSKGRETSVSDASLIEFIDTVMNLAQNWQCPIDFAGGDGYVRNVNMSQLRTIGLDDIASRRFILRKSDANAPYRVFINISERFRTEAFRRMFYVLTAGSYFKRIAVAAPGMERSDSVVVYTETKAEERDVIDALRPFANSRQQYFDRIVPPLSAQVPGLKGVATATTPPEIQITHMGDALQKLKRARQDFTTYRSQLIFMSLERSMARQCILRRGYVDFKSRVTENFRKAGLDVNNPSEQGDTVNVLEPWELAHKRKWDQYNNHNAIMNQLMIGGMGGDGARMPMPGGRRKSAMHAP